MEGCGKVRSNSQTCCICCFKSSNYSRHRDNEFGQKSQPVDKMNIELSKCVDKKLGRFVLREEEEELDVLMLFRNK